MYVLLNCLYSTPNPHTHTLPAHTQLMTMGLLRLVAFPVLNRLFLLSVGNWYKANRWWIESHPFHTQRHLGYSSSQYIPHKHSLCHIDPHWPVMVILVLTIVVSELAILS